MKKKITRYGKRNMVMSGIRRELTVKDQVIVAVYALLILYSLKMGMSEHLGVSMFGFFCVWINLRLFDVYAFKKKYAQ
jgi:Ca2+/Na+ antiporter